MAMVIQNNMAAIMTLGELNKNNNVLGKQLKKVASGERITGAGDDSSGYAISEKMRVRIRALGQADRNTQTGVSLIKTAEGAVQSQIEILKTIKAKVLDAQNDTNTDLDRATIQKEIDQGYRQMEDIAWETNYNGILLLCGGDRLSYEHTNWSKEEKPEFGVHDNNTQDISPLVTKTVVEDKSDNATAQSRVWTDMNQQPVSPDSEILGSVDSVYDAAAPYSRSIASIQPTIGTVANEIDMWGGTSWCPARWKIAISTSGMSTVDEVLDSLDNQSVTVTLEGEAKTFTFAYDTSLVSDAIPVSLQGIKEMVAGSGGPRPEAATRALARLADEVASAFGMYDVDGTSGNATQTKIYGEYARGAALMLASGEYDFSVSGTIGTITQGTTHTAQQFPYAIIDLDDFIGSTTDIEELVDKFLFKVRDDELNATDADPSDDDIFDTGNNLVVGKSFTFGNRWYTDHITYEFIDTGRGNTGTEYLYDNQKISGSTTCDLNNLREIYNSNGNDMKAALAQFLYNSIDYTSYGRNASYTRELLDSDGNVTGSVASADKIKFYAYYPFESDPYAYVVPLNFLNHGHYEAGRYAGAINSNYGEMNTDETYLCSCDLELKAWWAANSGDPMATGDGHTAASVGARLNQRGFRFYCPVHNTASSQNEWVNIYFTNHSIEDDIEAERPQAGKSPLNTGDKIDTIVVNVSNITNYKELTRAIYQQANPSWAVNSITGRENYLEQLGNPNTDYFSHFLFAMDEDNGILTIFDTDRYSHGREMFVSDGVYDNIRLEVRELKEKRLIIHDTDHASQAVAIHIPRTTLDYVFGFNSAKSSAADYTVLRKQMREEMLGMSKDSMGILDRGLNYLTSANCLLGAQINRLEYSHANLTVSVENTTHSESTLRDADMAKEMMEYTKANVLLQASQSMLAQANQNSSAVMSLLQ